MLLGLRLGPAKVNKIKIFSGPCYMIKSVLMFVSGVQESVLVDFVIVRNMLPSTRKLI